MNAQFSDIVLDFLESNNGQVEAYDMSLAKSNSLSSAQTLWFAEFILETNYSSRRIIRQTDNSRKYKSEDEFWICLDILRGLQDRTGNIAKI